MQGTGTAPIDSEAALQPQARRANRGGVSVALVVLLVLGGSGLDAWGGTIYRCTGSDGSVELRDRPCDTGAGAGGVKEEAVVLPGSAPANSKQAVTDPLQQIQEALAIVSRSNRKRADSRRAQAEAIAAERERDANCAKLASYRDEVASGGFFFRPGDPERNAMSDAELAAETSRATKAFNKHCR